MPAIQELSEKIEAYPGRIREAKEKKHYTIENIVDLSGVSTSSVGKLLSGVQIEPRLYNSAAICKVLDLSLDELFGLDKPVDTNEGLQQKIHELELENASLRGEVARLGRSSGCRARLSPPVARWSTSCLRSARCSHFRWRATSRLTSAFPTSA